jgi:tRNA threonylcarbamoyladenosine biosynthesis protein TsaE
MNSKRIHLPDADATADIGRHLARDIVRFPEGRFVIHLRGDLGAGKTTLSRGFLRGLGHEGRVPSPTYTLIEPYELQPKPVYHMDLYRLQDGAELEFLGIEDLPENAILLIEWPDRAADELGASDLSLELSVSATGRELLLQAHSEAAVGLIDAM